MTAADGQVDLKEVALIAGELNNLAQGLNKEAILEASDNMDPSKAFEVLKNLTTEEKKYVCGYLAAISLVDGDISDKELAIWKLVSTIANFPTMTIHEAITFWRSR
jgi:uncharacterized membrane protein YebE (DUF533 family)